MYDFLIVGQGIAGTVLSYYLQQNGFSVFVIDNVFKDSPSNIASGIYNPISLKRLSLIWQGNHQIKELNRFVKKFQEDFNTIIRDDIKIFKRFPNVLEKNKWLEYSSKENFKNYLGDIKEIDLETISVPFGIAPIHHSGRIRIASLLKPYSQRLCKEDLLLNEFFDYDKLKVSKKAVKYKNVSSKKIIFCEGPLVIKNPYFNYLPFALTKGELIIIKSKLELNYIINSSVFILPLGKDIYVVGSTYNWNEQDYIPTHSAKEELINKFKKISPCKFKVIDHKASVRPTTIDRRPIIGWHARYKNIGIFNGLGSKGIIMAPYLAKMFCENYTTKKPVLREATINRFNK